MWALRICGSGICASSDGSTGGWTRLSASSGPPRPTPGRRFGVVFVRRTAARHQSALVTLPRGPPDPELGPITVEQGAGLHPLSPLRRAELDEATVVLKRCLRRWSAAVRSEPGV